MQPAHDPEGYQGFYRRGRRGLAGGGVRLTGRARRREEAHARWRRYGDETKGSEARWLRGEERRPRQLRQVVGQRLFPRPPQWFVVTCTFDFVDQSPYIPFLDVWFWFVLDCCHGGRGRGGRSDGGQGLGQGKGKEEGEGLFLRVHVACLSVPWRASA